MKMVWHETKCSDVHNRNTAVGDKYFFRVNIFYDRSMLAIAKVEDTKKTLEIALIQEDSALIRPSIIEVVIFSNFEFKWPSHISSIPNMCPNNQGRSLGKAKSA